MSRIFLSLQVVAKRLPSVLKDMERTTSVWWLIVLTGFFITGSRQSRLQIITCVSGHTHTFSTKTSQDSLSSLNQRTIFKINDQIMLVSGPRA